LNLPWFRFEKLKAIGPIEDLSTERGKSLLFAQPPPFFIYYIEFTRALSDLVESHSDVIPILARGVAECSPYMSKQDMKQFLDSTIQARIGIRVIAEHHLALHNEDEMSSGIVHHATCPRLFVEKCSALAQELCEVNFGLSPECVINGQTDTKVGTPLH
jgi:hypothetical protein